MTAADVVKTMTLWAIDAAAGALAG